MQEKVEKVEKEEKKLGKSKKNKKPSESDNTSASVPSTPKSDNKPVTDEVEKIAANAEKAANNTEEHKTVENATEKTAAVFDELGGLLQ